MVSLSKHTRERSKGFKVPVRIVGIVLVLFVLVLRRPGNWTQEVTIQEISEKKSDPSLVLASADPSITRKTARTQEFPESDEALKKLCQRVETLQNLSSREDLTPWFLSDNRLLSQFYQDTTIISMLAKAHKEMKSKKPFLYVDAAAAWPKELSNTYLLDRCLGWEGICVEADASKLVMLREQRSCQLVDTVVTDEPGQLIQFSFTASGETGSNGIVSLGNGGRNVVTLYSTTLAKAFEKHGVTQVDFFSLDIEGAEAMALAGIDFSKVYIDIIDMEVDKHKSPEGSKGPLKETAQILVRILEEQGYLPLMKLFPGKTLGQKLPSCEFFLGGHSHASLFEDPGNSALRWTLQDALYIHKDSKYMPFIKDWVAIWGCNMDGTAIV